jgi:hypothetical protein
MQQQYYDLARSRRTGKRWAIALIEKMWDIAWDLWEHRNVILHEQDNTITVARIWQLDRGVSNTFKSLLDSLLLDHNNYLLKVPLPQLLKKTYEFKLAWIQCAEAVLHVPRRPAWVRQQYNRRMLQGMQRGMRNWLRR